MDIADWRKKIDEVDRKLVELLNERASAARAIGIIKRDTQAPVYEPEREREIFDNIRKANPGVLPDRELLQVFERIIDVMRKLQRDQLPGDGQAAVGGTQLSPQNAQEPFGAPESEVND